MATREELIAQLVSGIAAQAPMNPLLMASAFPANVSASGISSAFSPEILLASGILTPQRIAAAEQAALEQLQAEYLADMSKTVEKPYEASEAYLRDVITPYAGRTDDVADYLNGAFQSLASGQSTINDLKIKFAEANVPSLVQNQSEIYGALDEFDKRLNTRKLAEQKWNYDVSQATAGGMGAPTAEQARVRAFESLGLGNIAGALPSVNEQYQIPSEVFKNQERIAALEAELARASGNVMTASSRAFPATQYANKQAEVYSAKANQEALRKAVADAEAKAVGGNRPLFTMDGGKRVYTAPVEERRKEANLAAFAMEKARQAAAPKVPQITMEQISPSYASALSAQTNMSGAINTENERAARLAQKVSDRLAAAGITPYQQSVNQLINYAIATSRK